MPDPAEPVQARVTVVMTVRERHRLTVRSIESVLANTSIPIRFIFSHGVLPEWLDRDIEALALSGKIERRAFPDLHWPNHLRAAVLDEINTEFVVFIDNDILASPGWIERQLACADETGAGIVGPIYLWGDGETAPKVHMAGGRLRVTQLKEGKVMEDLHHHQDADPGAVREALARAPCDFVEYHCLLMRLELAKAPGVIDPEVVAVHEHIDASLGAKTLGRATWLEPTSDVTYLAFAPQVLEDLALMRHRWDSPAVERSIDAFCRKWAVLPDNRSFGGVRSYIHDMRWRHDPLSQHATATDLGEVMTREHLCQTPSALLDLAMHRKHALEDIALLARTCHLAAQITDGGYRPCGRPFVSHLLGTAAVLLRYNFRLATVCEGLLHSALTHRRAPLAAVLEALKRLNPLVEERVREHSGRVAARPPVSQEVGTLAPRQAEIAAIEAANEIDMRLSGEYDHSGRAPEIDAAEADWLARVLEMIGVPGMARTLRESVARASTVPAAIATGIPVSYRFAPDGKLVAMATPR